MGAVRGWKVVRVPASGQLSNVSALVLPERMPVADHEEMGSRDELVTRLLDILELTVRALNREAVHNALDAARDTHNGQLLRRLQDDPAALLKFYDEAIGTYQPPKAKRAGHRPNEKEMRVWAAFRTRYQKLEAEVRRDLQLTPDAEVTKETLSANGGEPPKTMGDHMQWHGLARDHWPPSTWPESPPNGQNSLF